MEKSISNEIKETFMFSQSHKSKKYEYFFLFIFRVEFCSRLLTSVVRNVRVDIGTEKQKKEKLTVSEKCVCVPQTI